MRERTSIFSFPLFFTLTHRTMQPCLHEPFFTGVVSFLLVIVAPPPAPLSAAPSPLIMARNDLGFPEP